MSKIIEINTTTDDDGIMTCLDGIENHKKKKDSER